MWHGHRFNRSYGQPGRDLGSRGCIANQESRALTALSQAAATQSARVGAWIGGRSTARQVFLVAAGVFWLVKSNERVIEDADGADRRARGRYSAASCHRGFQPVGGAGSSPNRRPLSKRRRPLSTEEIATIARRNAGHALEVAAVKGNRTQRRSRHSHA